MLRNSRLAAAIALLVCGLVARPVGATETTPAKAGYAADAPAGAVTLTFNIEVPKVTCSTPRQHGVSIFGILQGAPSAGARSSIFGEVDLRCDAHGMQVGSLIAQVDGQRTVLPGVPQGSVVEFTVSGGPDGESVRLLDPAFGQAQATSATAFGATAVRAQAERQVDDAAFKGFAFVQVEVNGASLSALPNVRRFAKPHTGSPRMHVTSFSTVSDSFGIRLLPRE